MLAEEPISLHHQVGGFRRPTFLPPLYISDPSSAPSRHYSSPLSPTSSLSPVSPRSPLSPLSPSLPSIGEDELLMSPTGSPPPPMSVVLSSPRHYNNRTPTTPRLSPNGSLIPRPPSPIPSRPPPSSSPVVFSVPPSVKGRTPRSSDSIPERPFN